MNILRYKYFQISTHYTGALHIECLNYKLTFVHYQQNIEIIVNIIIVP